MLKLILLTLTCFLSVPLLAQTQSPVDLIHVTAESLYLQKYPNASWKDPASQTQIQKIEAELNLLFSTALTPQGTARFQMRLPWQSGKVLLGFDNATQQSLLSQVTAQKVIDLTKNTLKETTINAALLAAGGKSLSGTYSLALEIDPARNPTAVAEELMKAKVPGLEFAEANRYMNNADPRLVRTELPHTILYVFNLGWGDCMAGCMAFHHEYYEVNYAGKVSHIGSSGESLPQTSLNLFKP